MLSSSFFARPSTRKEEDLDDEDRYAQIIIGKQRNGPMGRVKLAFVDQWTRFENPA